jgi:hypothetical protein
MAMVRGDEVFAQVVVGAGEDTLNRRMHVIEWHHSDKKVDLYEGKTLPPFVYINTMKNAKGQNVMQIFGGAKREKRDFSPTTLFLAVISFVGLCTYVIVAAIHAHRCFG